MRKTKSPGATHFRSALHLTHEPVIHQKKILLFLLIVFLTISCSGRRGATNTPYLMVTITLTASPTFVPIIIPDTLTPFPTGTSTPSATQTQIFTPNPTRTLRTKPTITPEKSATATQTLQPFQFISMEVKASIPVTASVPGSLVFYYRPGDDYLMKFDDGNVITTTIDQNVFNIFGVSPNGRWLAYNTFSSDWPLTWLVVRSADGTHQGKIRMPENWAFAGWIRNDLILFRDKKETSDVNQAIENTFLSPAILVNPFTGEIQEIPLDYPGVGDSFGFFDFSPNMLIYNSSLSRVIYPVFDNGSYYYFWDRQAQKTLAKLSMVVPVVLGGPIWMPDESGFLIQTYKDRNDTWFQVNQDGDVQQLTNIRDFPDSGYAPIDTDASLSPDGRYLAFSLAVKTDPDFSPWITLLDMQTLELTYYGAPNGDFRRWASNIVWSPDSRFIAVGYSVGTRTLTERTILIDLVDRWAAHLVDYAFPRGWMK